MKQKTKDNFIYLGVAGTIVAALTFYIFYTDKTMGRIPKIPGPILWGIFSTPVVIALILERFWEHRRRRALWIISGVAASINVLAMFIAYSFRWNLPVLVWSVATLLYLMGAFFMAEKFVVRNHSS